MKLFRISDDQKIDVIQEYSYRNQEVGGFGEVTLQELLTDYPELIPSEEISADDPPKFLVIKTEAGVTAGSIDILLIDHNGIPTVVETKLIDNREIRRSVLAQGVEYLAHIKTEWTAERFLEEGRVFWRTRQTDIEAEALKRLEVPFDDELIGKITSNTNQNKMRLIIASDNIPPELRRIIEFLNDASAFDIFGIEVRYFAAKEHNYRILAPYLVGFSETTKERKARGTADKWDYDRFFEVLQSQSTTHEVQLADELFNFGKEITGREVEWGVGKERSSFTARLVIGKEKFSLFSVYTTNQFTINIGWNCNRLKRLGIDISEEYRIKVKNELNMEFDQKSWEQGWPTGQLTTLIPATKEAFKALIKEFATKVQKHLLG